MLDFDFVRKMSDGPRRTAAIAAWFQGLFGERPPVLVGGAALELYTQGAYRTGDLDFVGRIPDEVARKLAAAGFRKRARHWVHEGARIFIELPAAMFDAPVRWDRVRFDEWTVVVISPEDLLVDRLAAWKFWKVVVEGVNAFLLWRDRGDEMNPKRLVERARQEHVADALADLQKIADRTGEGEAGIREVERWARTIRP